MMPKPKQLTPEQLAKVSGNSDVDPKATALGVLQIIWLAQGSLRMASWFKPA